MADLRIEGLHGGLDLLEEYYAPMALPTEQDPAVVERCPDVLSQTIKLCRRFNPDIVLEDEPVAMETPEFTFQSLKSGATGIAVVRAVVFPENSVVREDHPDTNVGLHARERGRNSVLLAVTPSAVMRKTPNSVRAGRHAELNYLLSVVRKLNEAAFPKTS